MAHNATDDLHIRSFQPLITPLELIRDLPCDDRISRTVTTTRQRLHAILTKQDDRLIVVIGPCSIHDPAAALDYAQRLRDVRAALSDTLEIVMRVYFEKPRTTVGWKGLINDPDLDESFDVNGGLRLARRLLCDINSMGVPAACEYLDCISPQYISDLVSWGAIGARTTESQIHREMASGLSCPVGFKNGTEGNVRIAVDAALVASRPHHFLAVTKEGRAAVAATRGNCDAHIILRGGRTPNYDAQSVDMVSALLAKAGLPVRIVIDASHANSGKDPERQPIVVGEIAAQVEAGDDRIVGAMVESHLVGGRQDLVPGVALTYGQSITDACADWDTSVRMMERLSEAVARRRRVRASRAIVA